MKRLWMIMGLVALTAGTAAGPGVNNGWDVCGPTGAGEASSSCTSNGGTRSFVVSFVSPKSFPGASVIGCRVLIRTADDAQLPSWWQMAPGACREGGLGLDFHELAGSPCDTIPSVVSTWDYVQHPGDADIIALTGSSGPGVDLVPGREYFVLRANINFVGTAGPDTCGGCWAPMEIVAAAVSISSADDSFMLADPDRRMLILWQPDIVPARATTWGQVKSLYRRRR